MLPISHAPDLPYGALHVQRQPVYFPLSPTYGGVQTILPSDTHMAFDDLVPSIYRGFDTVAPLASTLAGHDTCHPRHHKLSPL